MATVERLAVLSGRYELSDRLGQGGMAEVFAAEDRRLGRPVAVKILRAQLAADETVKVRFEQEARTAARLSHPNVVGIFDTGEEGDIAYIVMERLPGTTLADELGTEPVSNERALEIARQLLSALEAAHAVGIVHRDIKPANLLTCPDGRIKVADFGIATAMDEAHNLTSTGLLIGTPSYLAPERLSGAPATASTDLYSVGALLYLALTGRQPFAAKNTLALMAAIRDDAPAPVLSLNKRADPVLAGVAERALEKDPAARPASAHEMAEMLLSATAPTATFPLGAGTTMVMNRPGATEVLPRPSEPAAPEKSSRRQLDLKRLTELADSKVAAVARRYRIPLAFLAAALLALVIALPLAASGSGPGQPAPTTTPAHTAASYPPLNNVPGKLARAMTSLEKAVG